VCRCAASSRSSRRHGQVRSSSSSSSSSRHTSMKQACSGWAVCDRPWSSTHGANSHFWSSSPRAVLAQKLQQVSQQAILVLYCVLCCCCCCCVCRRLVRPADAQLLPLLRGPGWPA
jgi:hypothetical protein